MGKNRAARSRGARLRLSLSLLCLGAAIFPCPAQEAAGVSRARYLMGTICQGHIPPGSAAPEQSGAALEAAFDEIARLEEILSDWRPTSELSRLGIAGAQAPFGCSIDLFDFLTRSLALSKSTDGAFDITVAPLVALWDLRGAGHEATAQEVREALQHVGWRHLQLDAARREARLEHAGMRLDPGAIGKGYALDAAARVLRQRGVMTALLDFGGQILALGAPEGQPGWAVDIAHPLRRDEAALSIWLRDASISTSGNNEKGIVVHGRLLGHVLDPRSGLPVPARGDVSVISADAAAADALSTALLVMGPERGMRWLESHRELQAVFLDVEGDGKLRVLATPEFPSIHAAAGNRSTPTPPITEDKK